MVGRATLWIAVALLVGAASPSRAQTPQPISYTVSFPAPHSHYVEVEAAIPTVRSGYLELMMPIWTPGSYLVREYARHVESLEAVESMGAPLQVEKTRKNRWRVAVGKSDGIRLRYRVYAHEMSARTNWVDDEFALLNGAATFITIAEPRTRRPHQVRVVLPPGWKRSFSGMAGGGSENTYLAADYDTLVDSPLAAGNPAVYEFRVGGTLHYLVSFREPGGFDGARAARDLAKVAGASAKFWGGTPFERYYFLNIAGGDGGALEHRNSTVIMDSREPDYTRAEYVDWLSTAAHEYFHAWNVKRLRPVELGPFDYESEAYTRALWFIEGVTDYYAQLLLARAGVVTQDEYLELLSGTIRSLQTTPGRLVQSAEMASFDAWIKYYRPDENSPNSSVSYYAKGAVIGFLLDAKLRRLSGGATSLDTVMARLYERFSGEKGFTNAELRGEIERAAGSVHVRELRSFLTVALETTDELNYADALDWFGLRMAPATESPRAWLGVETAVRDRRTVVTQVLRGSPAALAGMSTGDEITAIDGRPLAAGQLTASLERLPAGSPIAVSVLRRDEVRLFQMVLAADPGDSWLVSALPAQSPEQRRRVESWLQ